MKLSDRIKKGYAGLNEGAWIDGIPYLLFSKIRLKVRRYGTPEFDALRDELKEEGTDLGEEENQRRILDECIIQTCLLDWSHPDSDEPYSIEAARGLLADPAAGVPFRQSVQWAIYTLSEKIEAQLEADAKNSAMP